MKHLPILALVASLLMSMSLFSQNSTIEILDLTSEYLTNPTGIDVRKPRLSWMLTSTNKTEYGKKQTAYQILVSSNKETLTKNIGDVWTSGWIVSDISQLIEYDGKDLKSDHHYFWKVQIKDELNRISKWSDVATWTTGLFDEMDWTADWIGSGENADLKKESCDIYDPWFRKSFVLTDKPNKALLHLASVGYHELYVNGIKISEDVLAPNVSNHRHRARYITYDIASYLQKGKNVVAVWLGSSWAIFPFYQSNDKPSAPIFIAQADVYSAKSIKPIFKLQTDESWKVHSSPNKLLGMWSFGNMGGEIWDANLEISDWNTIGYDDSKWIAAKHYAPALTLSSQMSEANYKYKELNAVSIEQKASNIYRVDMGENFAGMTEIKVKGNVGDTIHFYFSEREQDEMTFKNYSAFVIGTKGEGVFKNRFNYSSGRWITIKGLKTTPSKSDIRGWTVRSGYDNVASFESSDSLQNWMYDRVKWTFENLSIGGYIVDCPQRERLGYGGDAHATSETGMFNYALGSFYTKWMQDWRDVQGVEPMTCVELGGGILPHTAPTMHGGGGPAWGGIVISLPWFMYQHYGDRRVLEENFEMMIKWLAFLDSHVKEDILTRFGGEWDFLADWLWPGATAEGMNNDKSQAICFNSSYMVYNLRTAAKVAQILGKDAEARAWKAQAERMSKAIHHKFYNVEDQSYSDKSMSNLAMALLAEVPPVELYDVIMKRLEHDILEVNKGHINVGITGGAVLFKLLREQGRDNLIYAMTSKKDYPSWGYMKDNGATTMWEMWEKDLPGHSLLHSSYLYPGAWYVEGVGGIKGGKDGKGFKEFFIKVPLFNKSQINNAKSSFKSPYGLIETTWSKLGDKYELEVHIPINTEATIYFPYSSNDVITEKSGYAQQLGVEGEYMLYRVKSGVYNFKN